MSELIKLGNRIVPKPAGCDYNLIPGKIYDLKSDIYQENLWLEENGDFNLPPKIYYAESDKKFIEKIIIAFNNTKKNTTGVLFNGVKGTGKTVMAKKLAIDSNLPVIIPHVSFPTKKLTDFFKQFTTPVCILFDEIEKTRDTEKLLTFLDGIEATCKKLVIMTSNKSSAINENLFDRPSRVRYYREFESNNSVYIKEIIKDQNIDDTNDEIYTFITTKFKTISIDNIMALLEEIKLFGKDDLPSLVEYLNIVPSEKISDYKISEDSFSESTNELLIHFDKAEDDAEDDDE